MYKVIVEEQKKKKGQKGSTRGADSGIIDRMNQQILTSAGILKLETAQMLHLCQFQIVEREVHQNTYICTPVCTKFKCL